MGEPRSGAVEYEQDPSNQATKASNVASTWQNVTFLFWSIYLPVLP